MQIIEWARERPAAAALSILGLLLVGTALWWNFLGPGSEPKTADAKPPIVQTTLPPDSSASATDQPTANPSATTSPTASQEPSQSPSASPSTEAKEKTYAHNEDGTPWVISAEEDNLQAPEIGDWKPVAEGFAKAWANPSVGGKKWRAAIKPYLTSDAYDAMSSADIENVPQWKFSHATQTASYDQSNTVNLAYEENSKGAKLKMIILSNGDWLIDEVG
jgi:hypothetical protein